ncbi:MAG TPA: CsbD family protein [Candidatus Acidoferrales bacterium]|nr:CsbD family protein [Candidatus Acidoferrales bacterium]
MKQGTKDAAKGRFHEAKGKIKQKVGQATNNPKLEGEGQGEKIGGKVQKKIGQVEKVLDE